MTEYYPNIECACGCDGLIEIRPHHKYNGIPIFIKGHNRRGKEGYWRGKKHSEETKKKISDANKGIEPWNKGKKLTDEHKKNMSDSLKGKTAWNKGKKLTEEHKKKLSENHAGISGPNHPQWIDGRSFKPYLPVFNFALKESIRDRDKRKCQKCGKTEKQNGQKLCVHHIDYNKENCSEDNLISFCRSCNTKVNKNREYWKKYFQDKIKNITNSVVSDVFNI